MKSQGVMTSFACRALVGVLLLGGVARAEVPTTFTIQGVLRDSTGQLQSGVADVRLEFFTDATGDTAAYTRVASSVPITGGVFTATVDIQSQPALFDMPLWLQTTVLTNPVETLPRFALSSVPYAFSAARLGGKVAGEYQEKLTAQAPLDFNGNQVRFLPAGTCADGSVLVLQGSTWSCGADKLGVYTATLGGGLVLDVNAFSIAPGGIDKSMLGTGAVISEALADGEVKEADLAPDAVTSAVIKDGEVKEVDLAPGAVTSAVIKDGEVHAADLAPSAINHTHLDAADCTGAGGFWVDVGGAFACGSLAATGGATASFDPDTAAYTVSAAAGSGDPDYIQNATAAGFTAQAASISVTGNVQTAGTLRTGSEAIAAAPSYPNGSSGLVIRRVVSSNSAAGQIIAITSDARVERDGSAGGLKLVSTAAAGALRYATCIGTSGTAAIRAAVSTTGPASAVIFADATAAVFVECMFGDFSAGGHVTTLSMSRGVATNAVWVGTLTSSINQ